MKKEEKIIAIASGYFNPVHKGHIELFERAKLISNELIVIVNNDYQRELKGSKKFQDEQERVKIISNLRLVNHTELSIDKDRSVVETLEKIYHKYKILHQGFDVKFIFVNGGDQFSETVAEKTICQALGISMLDEMGDKIQSSSDLLKLI
jgi:cytidyltransferase-like protein